MRCIALHGIALNCIALYCIVSIFVSITMTCKSFIVANRCIHNLFEGETILSVIEIPKLLPCSQTLTHPSHNWMTIFFLAVTGTFQ